MKKLILILSVCASSAFAASPSFGPGGQWTSGTFSAPTISGTMTGNFTRSGTTTGGTISALTLTGTTSGSTLIISGSVALNGNTTLGDASADTLTITAGTVTASNQTAASGSSLMTRDLVRADAISTNNISAKDDFISVISITGGFASDLAWSQYSAGGGTGATRDNPFGTSPNHGLVGVTCGNATNAGNTVYLNGLKLLGAAGWEMQFIVSLVQTTDCDMIVGVTIDNSAIGIGKFGGKSIGVRYSSATDSNFMFFSKNTDLTFAANDANNYSVSSGVAVDTAYHTFRIRSLVTGEIQMSIDGGSYVAVTQVISTPSALTYIPYFYISTRTTTIKRILCDYFSFRQEVTRP